MPALSHAAEEVADATVKAGESLDDLDFATEPGFVGVVDVSHDALDQREDCIEPG